MDISYSFITSGFYKEKPLIIKVILMLEFKVCLRFIKKYFMQSLIIFLTIVISGSSLFLFFLGSVLRNMILEQSSLYKEHLNISSSKSSTIDNYDFNLYINHNLDKYLKNSTYSTNLNVFIL